MNAKFMSRCYKPLWQKRFFATAKNPKTPFEILSLTEKATTAEIKQRYKELAKTLHPDKKSTGNLAQFQELVQAYELLVDPHKRTYYIKSGYGWGANQGRDTSRYPPPGHRPASYTNAPWAETNNNFTSNTTFMSILAGVVVAIGTVNLVYFQSSNTLLNAANQHHLKTSDDLKRARTEAQLFGNDRGINRVIENRMKQFRDDDDEEED
jgi:curved DNA-binding protein CbpA